MKDRVNFLSSLQAGDDFRNRVRQTFLVIAALGVVVLSAWFGILQFQVSNIQKENRALDTRIDQLKDLHVLQASLSRKKEDLLERRERLHRMLEIQSGMQDGKARWSGILADLAGALPQGVWLDRLQVKTDEGEPGNTNDQETLVTGTMERPGNRVQVTLSGRTFSQEELLDFLSRMEDNPRWESATLRKTGREPNATMRLPDLYRFEITLVPAA